jgi:hypothetical protein
VLKLVSEARPLRVPRLSRWSGLDARSCTTLCLLVTLMAAVFSGPFDTYRQRLVSASDALCGGDVEFVSTIDGIGVPAWGHPHSAQPSAMAQRGYPDGATSSSTSERHRRALPPQGARFFSERVVDYVAQQFGKDVQIGALGNESQRVGDGVDDPCPTAVCYAFNTSGQSGILELPDSGRRDAALPGSCGWPPSMRRAPSPS